MCPSILSNVYILITKKEFLLRFNNIFIFHKFKYIYTYLFLFVEIKWTMQIKNVAYMFNQKKFANILKQKKSFFAIFVSRQTHTFLVNKFGLVISFFFNFLFGLVNRK